ncbi:MAG: UDP-N-acetylmuramate--L-alanine ligase, partial [Pseudomonadota bacterium]|nr:UDP-N-acetylmuramate--L-alanine ligase [Pseudomonadota bacterium]
MQSKVADTKLPRDLGPIHFIGIGGIGMSGIAELLLNLGYTVSGSDLKNTQIIERLRGLGVTIQVGHNSSNITHAAIVVISSAINRDNIELIEARKRSIPVVRRSEMLAELMRLRSNIAIAGTHGKTTTTSMVAAVLEAGELDPTVINGGIIQAYGSNARLGAGDWMVVEADESDGTLVKIPTTIAVVTNLDPEHLEYYGSFNDLKETFLEFLDNIPFYGVGICCLDHPIVRSLISQTRDRRILTYGFNDRADFAIRDLNYSDQKAYFDIYIKSQESKIALELPMYGDHNVSNATVAIAVASHLKISSSAMVNGLKNFKGVKRRFTKVCRWNGIDIIDDYAHHPVEI